MTIPAPTPGFKASFEKIQPREVWALRDASLAMGLQMQGTTIEDARVVFGGIAGKPYREKTVEAFLKGKTINPQLIGQAQAMALADSAPLKYNAQKIDMAKGLGPARLGSGAAVSVKGVSAVRRAAPPERFP